MSSSTEKGQYKIVRKSVTFSGRVQGVGFRYRASYAARSLGLTGWVRNEWDGTVAMEVQGDLNSIYKMITLINQGSYVQIENVDMKDIEVLEHENGFSVRG